LSEKKLSASEKNAKLLSDNELRSDVVLNINSKFFTIFAIAIFLFLMNREAKLYNIELGPKIQHRKVTTFGNSPIAIPPGAKYETLTPSERVAFQALQFKTGIDVKAMFDAANMEGEKVEAGDIVTITVYNDRDGSRKGVEINTSNSDNLIVATQFLIGKVEGQVFMSDYNVGNGEIIKNTIQVAKIRKVKK
jgi:hypothetical protein